MADMDDRRRPVLLLSPEQEKVLSAFEPGDPVVPALVYDFGVAGQSDAELAQAIAEARARWGGGLLAVGGRQAFGLDTENEDPFEEDPDGAIPFDRTVGRYAACARRVREAGCGAVLFSRLPSITEARAALLGGRSCGLPVWLAADLDREGEDMEDGTDVLATFVTLQSLGAAAFGFGRPDSGELILPSLERVAPYAVIPLYARPECLAPGGESGEPGRVLTPAEYGALAQRFVDLGVELCGGGYGARSVHLLAVKEALSRPRPRPERLAQDNILLCTHNQTFFLKDNLDVSDPVACGEDMSDDLLSLEELGSDVLCIRLEHPEDPLLFARNSYLLGLPVSFLSDDPALLAQALHYFPGRAAVDSRSVLERPELEAIAARWGAVVI